MIKITKEDFERECENYYLETGLIPTKADLKSFGRGFSYTAALRVDFHLKTFALLMAEKYSYTRQRELYTCPCCGEKFASKYKEQIYCSHTCAATVTNTKKKFVKKECIQCGQGFLAQANHAKFCSSYCQGQHNHKVPASLRNKDKPVVVRKTNVVRSEISQVALKEAKFKEWIETGCYVPNQRLRKYLVRTDGYKCKCCGISEWNNKPVTLDVEHIDGDSENCAVENICFLCPNCHSQTPTYKSKNKGNGRHTRRQRYAEGKSY